MAEKSISQKWYNLTSFPQAYKQFINKIHLRRKLSTSSRKSISKAAAAAVNAAAASASDHNHNHNPNSSKKQQNHHHTKVNGGAINGGGIQSHTCNEQIQSSAPSPSPPYSPSSRSMAGSPLMGSSLSSSPINNNNHHHNPPSPLSSSPSSSSSRRIIHDNNNNNHNYNPPSPLSSSSSSSRRINHDNKNNMFYSGNLGLSRNRSTSSGTSLLRNISKKNSSNYNNVDSHHHPTHSFPSFSGPLSRSISQRSSSLIIYSNSNGIVKPPTLEQTLECTLEELCFGCIKKIKTTRDEIANDGQIIDEYEEELTINVQPGWRNGTKITFEGTGKATRSSSTNGGGGSCCDITFTVTEKEHQVFRKEGNDLELEMEISLMEALTGCTVGIPLLSGENMDLTINEVIEPGYRKIISGQGMTKPHHNEEEQQEQEQQGNKRGNLIITFQVRFPTQLTEEQSSEIIRILKNTTNTDT